MNQKFFLFQLHSEYRSTYRWHEYTPKQNQVVRTAPQSAKAQEEPRLKILVLSGGGATIFDLFLLAELKWVESTILEGFSQAKQQGKLLYFPPSSNSSNWVAQYENISVLFIWIIECLADHDLTA